MTGYTGYTEFDNGLAPEGPDQMNSIFEHFDEKLAAPRSTVSLLPVSGNWPGRTMFVEDDDSTWQWDGSAWKLVLSDTGWVDVTTFGANWSPTTNYTPRVRRVKTRVDLVGAATIGTGATFDDILEIPAGFRPGTQVFVGMYRMQTSGATGELHISPGAGATQFKLTSPSAYRTGSPAAGQTMPLHCFWYTD